MLLPLRTSNTRLVDRNRTRIASDRIHIEIQGVFSFHARIGSAVDLIYANICPESDTADAR